MKTIESIEPFQIRRVKYIVENLKKVKSGIQEWEVIRLAGLKKKTALKMKKNILEILNG